MTRLIDADQNRADSSTSNDAERYGQINPGFQVKRVFFSFRHNPWENLIQKLVFFAVEANFWYKTKLNKIFFLQPNRTTNFD